MRLTMESIEEKFNQNEKEHLDIRISNEKEHITIMTELKKVGEDIANISIQIAKLPQDILDLADKRYASKTAERVIYGLVGAVCLAFVYGLIELIKNGNVVA